MRPPERRLWAADFNGPAPGRSVERSPLRFTRRELKKETR